ncbi:hypothetical protein FQN50_007900 [Emmonsiellopsis sp. PD_5]|nr:hypothetical protein FQN50_007900 [Emmonsiellopsis sp. PD_5]
MKLYLFTLLLALVLPAVCAAALPQKAVVVTYPADTPNSVIDQAKEAIKEAGGTITHEYNLIKGFAAMASAKALEAVSALETAYNPFIEEDTIVSVGGQVNG